MTRSTVAETAAEAFCILDVPSKVNQVSVYTERYFYWLFQIQI
jgi:hypothetical protein